MTKHQQFSFVARSKSFYNAIQGILYVLQTQHNAWIHASVSITVCGAGMVLAITRTEWCLLILCIIAVWTAEAFNTALECLTDLVSPEFHPLAGRAKDTAASAVLIAAIGSVIVGALVFLPHIWLRFSVSAL